MAEDIANNVAEENTITHRPLGIALAVADHDTRDVVVTCDGEGLIRVHGTAMRGAATNTRGAATNTRPRT